MIFPNLKANMNDNVIKANKWGLSRILVIEFAIFAIFFAGAFLTEMHSIVSVVSSLLCVFIILVVVPLSLAWAISNRTIKIFIVIILIIFWYLSLWSLFHLLNTPIT